MRSHAKDDPGGWRVSITRIPTRRIIMNWASMKRFAQKFHSVVCMTCQRGEGGKKGADPKGGRPAHKAMSADQALRLSRPRSLMIVAEISSIDFVVELSQRMPSRRMRFSASKISSRQFSIEA